MNSSMVLCQSTYDSKAKLPSHPLYVLHMPLNSIRNPFSLNVRHEILKETLVFKKFLEEEEEERKKDWMTFKFLILCEFITFYPYRHKR